MEYYKILNLNKEPFSNSPDPDLFFQSRQHLTCLQQLEISIRLKRGLCVVIGEVGTGKTTLCRQLIRKLSSDESVETYLILDPYFESSSESLSAVAQMFDIEIDNQNNRQIKEKIKNFLFLKGIEEKKNIILIIDEGQKLPDFFIETLREFLNYETNEYKLMQIVIFAQKEFENNLKLHKNFSDRVSSLFFLEPLSFPDMKNLIQFRLQKSGYANNSTLFTYPALWKIFRATRGYPRKMMNLCHQCILMLIIQNKVQVGSSIVHACIKRQAFKSQDKIFILRNSVIFLLLILTISLTLIKFSDRISLDFLINKSAKKNNPGKTILLAKQNHKANPVDMKIVKENKDVQIKKNLPELLGTTEVHQGETMGELAKLVYGTATPDIIQKVLDVNPHIKSPNRISIGQAISFPCIPAKTRYMTEQNFFIEISNEDILESAFEILRTYKKKGGEIPIKLIPYKNINSNQQFALIYDKCFTKKELMHKKIEEINSRLHLKFKMLTSWNQDTTFFSDPYQN